MTDRPLGRLDLEALRRLATRPPLYAPHEAPFWDDPHISKGMLAAHLDPEWDSASRPHTVIDAEVAWLVEHLRLRPGDRFLDLGCGPGLYCERLASRGLVVTGVDLSPRSLDYARRSAAEKALPIEYVEANYTRLADRLDRPGEFDAACIINLDFAVLPDDARDSFLAGVYRALRPGGVLVFDVPTRSIHREGAEHWAVEESGFWSDSPYLELTREFEYPEATVDCQQTIILTASGEARVYRIWSRWCSPETIAPVLAARGFAVESVWADLTGRPLAPDSPTLGVVARKG
jgi:SAM-dependent methyltransferase